MIGKVEEWDRELILKSWAKAAEVGVVAFGRMLFKQLMKICPEMNSLFPFMKDVQEIDIHGEKVVLMINDFIANLNDPEALQVQFEQIKKQHESHNLLGEHHTLFKFAITETFKEVLKEAFSTEIRDAWINLYNFIRNNWAGYDMHEEERDPDDSLTILR